MSETDDWQCTLRLVWLLAGEGGRLSGPPRGQYFATAVFVLGADVELTPGWPVSGEHFSIALEIPSHEGSARLARARFLAPSLAAAYARPGAELLLMEGPRTVAAATVVDVHLVADVDLVDE